MELMRKEKLAMTNIEMFCADENQFARDKMQTSVRWKKEPSIEFNHLLLSWLFNGFSPKKKYTWFSTHINFIFIISVDFSSSANNLIAENSFQFYSFFHQFFYCLHSCLLLNRGLAQATIITIAAAAAVMKKLQVMSFYLWYT